MKYASLSSKYYIKNMSNSNLQIARELLDYPWSIHNPSALSDIHNKLINFLLNKGIEYNSYWVKREEIYISFFRELINANYENEENLIYYSTMILDLIFDEMGKGKDIGDFKFLFKDLVAFISDKTSLSKNIKTVFKLKLHNDYQSISEVIDIVKSPHELWEFKYKNLVLLDNKNCMLYKTPPIMHQLWLIRGGNIKEIDDVNIDHIKNTHELLTKSTYEWQHILWTNNKELMPDSVQKLISMGMVMIVALGLHRVTILGLCNINDNYS